MLSLIQPVDRERVRCTRSQTSQQIGLGITSYWLRYKRHFTPPSIGNYRSNVSSFLTWAGERRESISSISLSDVYEFLKLKRETDCKPAKMATYSQTLRTFFRFFESQGRNEVTEWLSWS